MKWTLMFVCVLVCLVDGIAALNCYQCTSLNNNCNDPFDKVAHKNLLTDCQSGEVCMKTKYGDFVNRLCTLKPACTVSGGINVCGDDTVGNYICCCTTDGCNGATTTSISYLVVTALLVLTKALH